MYRLLSGICSIAYTSPAAEVIQDATFPPIRTAMFWTSGVQPALCIS